MKRTFAIVILLRALCSVGQAQQTYQLEAPHDNVEVRASICNRSELKPFQTVYSDITGTRLWQLRLDEVVKIFGPKIATTSNWWGFGRDTIGKISGPNVPQHPADLVMPIIAFRNPWGNDPAGLTLGLGGTPWSYPRIDRYAIGDIGYVELYIGGQMTFEGYQERVCAAIIYFRADGKFMPLTSTENFPKRLEWEQAKFALLTKWLDEHMPKVTDLGVVEVSTANSSRLDLGAGSAWTLRIQSPIYSSGANLFYQIGLLKDTTDPKERQESYDARSISGQGEAVQFHMDGKLYRLTPKLVGQEPEPIK